MRPQIGVVRAHLVHAHNPALQHSYMRCLGLEPMRAKRLDFKRAGSASCAAMAALNMPHIASKSPARAGRISMRLLQICGRDQAGHYQNPAPAP